LSRESGSITDMVQAQKFTSVADEDDDELEEESLLETPLDKVEPYSMFKHAILSRFFFLLAPSQGMLIKRRPPTRAAGPLRECHEEPQPRGKASG
jgi:hypothetical protein